MAVTPSTNVIKYCMEHTAAAVVVVVVVAWWLP